MSHHLGCSVVSACQLICTIPSGCFLKISSKIKNQEPKNLLNQVSRNDPSSMVALLALVRAQILNPLPNSEADDQAPRVHEQHLDFDHLKPPMMLQQQHSNLTQREVFLNKRQKTLVEPLTENGLWGVLLPKHLRRKDKVVLF